MFLSLALIAGAGVNAQYFRASEYWKTHRQEISLGVGITNFLGELGGRNATGSPFIWDLEFSETRPALSVGYQYYLLEHFSIRLAATYGKLTGSDALTHESFRQNRNLSFRSDLFEGQLRAEFHPLIETSGHTYDLRGVQSNARGHLGLYVFAGVGIFHFNPQAQYKGAWIDLSPLGTEGQGLPEGPAPYSLTGVCIPMGIGIRKAFDKKITLGVELQYTKTFTDYIDDVSGVYYDNAMIETSRGSIAAYFADPSLGDIPGQTVTGEQRGQPDHDDGYMFLKVDLHYKLYKREHRKHKLRNHTRRMRIIF